jgi:predicted HicB family RNase H-like nuclease
MPQLHFAAPQETADTLRRLAAKEGISVNAYVMLFLNDIA